MDGPILLKPNITPQPPGGADTAGPALSRGGGRDAHQPRGGVLI